MIEQAYHAVRRENAVRYLLARLNRGGRGTRVEVHPFNQFQVAEWVADDGAGLDNAWV
ncbi:hypothetical protein ABZV29_38150 [Streptomyces sp. NPDC005236]|uniref:hypothetical protein n=1 Tax=Streptomyces sp. NPDC005236 TaxID=3157028 RepID=UPI0033ACE520